MLSMRHEALALIVCLGCASSPALAQTVGPPSVAPPPAVAPADVGMTTLTVFLKHDESQTLDEINARLHRQHFYESFPPPGVEVLSWNVLMGVGQVVTLRFPAERLREVNRAIEKTAWGGYRTEFFPTYDYRPTAAKEREGLPSSFK